MNRICCSIVFTFHLLGLHGQTSFSILPDVGGINRQAIGLIGIADSTGIKIIGHRYDTILPGSNAKPYLAHFNYDGQLESVVHLIDTLYAEPFNLEARGLEKKNDSIYYFRAQRDIGDPYFRPYVSELNINSGQIVRSSVIINSESPLLAYGGEFIRYGVNNTLLLLNELHKGDSVLTFVNLLDTLFNEKKVIIVKGVSRKTFAKICNMNQDESLVMIGYCLVNDGTGNEYNYETYLDSVDINGNIIVHILAPTSIPIYTGVNGTKTVLQDKYGNWIISGTYKENIPDTCDDCYRYVPYIFSTSPDFKTLRWETRFFDFPEYEDDYSLYSMTQVEDGYIVSGDFFNYNGYDSGVLFKAANNGDSLWMKHYIPLNWDEDRVAWVRFYDVKTSPYGTIIVAGAVGDIQENIIRPWILQLDKDGCLVPGCNIVATHDENIRTSQDNFTIYPNPASSEIYILSKITSTDPLNISIISNEDIEIKSRNFNPISGYQYALPLDDLPSGIYYLTVTNPKTGQVESHKFVRQ